MAIIRWRTVPCFAFLASLLLTPGAAWAGGRILSSELLAMCSETDWSRLNKPTSFVYLIDRRLKQEVTTRMVSLRERNEISNPCYLRLNGFVDRVTTAKHRIRESVRGACNGPETAHIWSQGVPRYMTFRGDDKRKGAHQIRNILSRGVNSGKIRTGCANSVRALSLEAPRGKTFQEFLREDVPNNDGEPTLPTAGLDETPRGSKAGEDAFGKFWRAGVGEYIREQRTGVSVSKPLQTKDYARSGIVDALTASDRSPSTFDEWLDKKAHRIDRECLSGKIRTFERMANVQGRLCNRHPSPQYRAQCIQDSPEGATLAFLLSLDAALDGARWSQTTVGSVRALKGFFCQGPGASLCNALDHQVAARSRASISRIRPRLMCQ